MMILAMYAIMMHAITMKAMALIDIVGFATTMVLIYALVKILAMVLMQTTVLVLTMVFISAFY